ncbi:MULTISPECIES: hypothetical protein [Streptomyces violaceusniger group]|uniref:Alcohol dehydrogenase n=2 Tax=Streptomyces rhizosphaericus TaxID=114699 RepID=A0ABN1RKR4_9ACTN|nr:MULTISPECIES: hypothetical protein [Streptomyces violaceusniger group]
MRKVSGWAAHAPGAAVTPWDFERRKPQDKDIAVRVRYCGV